MANEYPPIERGYRIVPHDSFAVVQKGWKLAWKGDTEWYNCNRSIGHSMILGTCYITPILNCPEYFNELESYVG